MTERFCELCIAWQPQRYSLSQKIEKNSNPKNEVRHEVFKPTTLSLVYAFITPLRDSSRDILFFKSSELSIEKLNLILATPMAIIAASPVSGPRRRANDFFGEKRLLKIYQLFITPRSTAFGEKFNHVRNCFPGFIKFILIEPFMTFNLIMFDCFSSQTSKFRNNS